jgi:Transglycosylase-like domain
MTVVLTALAMMLPLPGGGVQTAVRTDDYHARHKGCNTRACDKRVDRKARRKMRHRKWVVVRPYNAKLNRMAQCESGGRWHIATGNGFYGGLQFVPSTWWSVGGRGMPHQHTPLEQKFRAVKLIKREGYRPWPVCGYV